MITITVNFPEYTDSFDVDAVVDVIHLPIINDTDVFVAFKSTCGIVFTPQDYKKYVGIEDIDNATNEIMDFIREITGMDSDSDEDDELYTIVHDMMHGGYEETEFVPYFETVEDGVQVINRLKQDKAPNISNEEFARDLHFDSQTPYHLIKSTVEAFILHKYIISPA